MRNPVLGISLSIQCRALNVNVLVGSIKIDITYRRDFSSLAACDIDLWEVWWGDEIYVLAGDWPKTHH